MSKLYVHYGCGMYAPEDWLNFDASPTLRIQKIPILRTLLKKSLKITFPQNVKYGNIIKGLPVSENSCDGVYCSHTLEHLSLTDFNTALKNTYKILKPGGIFRCVVPDLEAITNEYYLNELAKGNKSASIRFMESTMLGVKERPRGIKGAIDFFFSNAHHLWMWDYSSLSEELRKAGFNNIRACKFNDCKDEMFKSVESQGRFWQAVAIECTK